MFFSLFFILQLVLPKSNPATKNSNPSQEHQRKRKEKTNYHLWLFYCWTWALPFIPNKNNSLGLKTQTTWPLKIKINFHCLKTQTTWPTRQTPAKPNKTQIAWPTKLIPQSKPQQSKMNQPHSLSWFVWISTVLI